MKCELNISASGVGVMHRKLFWQCCYKTSTTLPVKHLREEESNCVEPSGALIFRMYPVEEVLSVVLSTDAH